MRVLFLRAEEHFAVGLAFAFAIDFDLRLQAGDFGEDALLA